ncbi:MAG: type II secretion system F family protein [Syntrophales bacterium]
MPIFSYKGYSAEGTEIKGSLDALGLKDAIIKVKSYGIHPADVFEVREKGERGIFHKIDDTFLPNMTRQLSTLLSAGVPLMEALQAISNENIGFYREILIAIKERVSGGTSLSRALESYGRIFPVFYINMVQVGEASGILDKILIKLADFLENQNEIRSKVRSSTIYPIFMMGVSVLVLAFLFTFVMPKIVKIFNDMEGTLPFITLVLIFISNIFIKYWWAMIVTVATAIWFMRRFLVKHRATVDKLLLRLPGNIIQSLYYARFARTMGFLLDGGVPMLKSLKFAGKSIGNRELESQVLAAEGKVAEGGSLSSSLRGFPPVLIQLVSTGEKSGRLAETMNRAAESYEEEFNGKMEKAVSLFEPVMILLMGLVVCFIVLAVLLPIFQLNQLIK